MKSYITIFANLRQSILRYVQYRLSIHRLQQRREGGFTLVELMVVVAVIAILAAIAMPQFMSAADKAKQSK